MAASGTTFVNNFPDYFREWPMISMTVGTLAVCVSFYILHIGRKPELVTKAGSRFQTFLHKHCPILREPYWPTIWCYGGRAQTVIGAIMRSHPEVQYRRELLNLPDGGELYLDWLDNGCDDVDDPDKFPTVLIMPGLTGDSKHGYILNFVKQVQELGYRAVVFNNRGLAGAQLRTPRSFCAANTDDVEYVIKYLNESKPGIPIVAVAVSLGGIILSNYLVKMRQSKSTGLLAAMTVSVPWNTFKSSESLEEPVNWFMFNLYLTKCLHSLVRAHQHMAVKAGITRDIDIDHVYQSRTIREFDDRFIAPMFGFRDSDHYYDTASLHSKPLDEVSIPLLSLAAADDPFAPAKSLPLDKIRESPNVAMVLTAFGGHIGFTEGLVPVGTGYADRLMRQYIKAIFDNQQTVKDWGRVPYQQ